MIDYHRPHILIVSDDLDLGQFLQDGLTIAGFWTSTVASALQTLELFRLRTFDLMVVDGFLEGLGAEQLVRRLRAPASPESGGRTDIPIIVVAGSNEETSPEQVANMGADIVLYPPIEIEELAVDLFGRIREWRSKHPGRPWADQATQQQT